MPPRRKAPVAEKRRAPEAETTAPEAKKIVSPEAEGTPPICPLCLEWLEKDAQPMWVTPRGPNEPGPSSTGALDLKNVVSLACGHVFHKVCITDLFEKSIARDKTCPVLCPNCRQVIKNKNFMKKLHLSFEGGGSAIKCSRENCINERKQAEEDIRAFQEASVLQSKRETDLKTENELLVLDKTRMQNEKEKTTGKIGDLENTITKLEDEKESWIAEKEHLERKNFISDDAKQRLEAEINDLKEENRRLKYETTDLRTAEEDLKSAERNLIHTNYDLEHEHHNLEAAMQNLHGLTVDKKNERQELHDRILAIRLSIAECIEMKRFYEERVRRLRKIVIRLDPHYFDGCVILDSD